MNGIFNTANLLYWLCIALVMLAATATVGKTWKRNEAGRWTLGYVLVFLLGAPLVFSGQWHADTYLSLFFGVGISGGIKAGYALWCRSREAERIRRGTNGYHQYRR